MKTSPPCPISPWHYYQALTLNAEDGGKTSHDSFLEGSVCTIIGRTDTLQASAQPVSPLPPRKSCNTVHMTAQGKLAHAITLSSLPGSVEWIPIFAKLKMACYCFQTEVMRDSETSGKLCPSSPNTYLTSCQPGMSGYTGDQWLARPSTMSGNRYLLWQGMPR